MNQPQGAPMQALPTSCGLAIASLVCGICGFILGPLTGIPAVITGHIALSKIKKSGGIIHGRGMAIAGLILGYITTALLLLIIIIGIIAGATAPFLIGQTTKSDQTVIVNHSKIIGIALLEFENEFGFFPGPKTLETLKTVYPKAAELDLSDPLNQLLGAELLNDESSLLAPDSAKGEWLYFGSDHTSSIGPSAVLLISPVIQGKRAVLRCDNTVTLVDDLESNRLISYQSNSPVSIIVRHHK